MQQAAISPTVLQATPISSALGIPRSSEGRRPGERGADAPNQGDRARHQPGLRVHAEASSHPHAQQVLEHDVEGRERGKHRQRPAAGDERLDFGLEADPGEEVDQQPVTDLQVEDDLPVRGEVQNAHGGRAQEAADHGLRDAVATQHRIAAQGGLAEE
jgi:hypothetical protein